VQNFIVITVVTLLQIIVFSLTYVVISVVFAGD